jgi:hypothetical protein
MTLKTVDSFAQQVATTTIGRFGYFAVAVPVPHHGLSSSAIALLIVGIPPAIAAGLIVWRVWPRSREVTRKP